jgi:hypothetical protein
MWAIDEIPLRAFSAGLLGKGPVLASGPRLIKGEMDC